MIATKAKHLARPPRECVLATLTEAARMANLSRYEIKDGIDEGSVRAFQLKGKRCIRVALSDVLLLAARLAIGSLRMNIERLQEELEGERLKLQWQQRDTKEIIRFGRSARLERYAAEILKSSGTTTDKLTFSSFLERVLERTRSPEMRPEVSKWAILMYDTYISAPLERTR